ncbi:MAG: DUF2847 family protein [Bacteroidetes bacterium]|nr:DUF2847 family protein [Bacteroidota bacterium]MBX7239698.1 DUF2847 family protein [Bacteroidia bacterium]MCC7514290.1 DUF2847 family protein [Bacteroidia bacterium]MCW5920471.1 DUF2847 family protein [Bacteroidota bacterium]HCI58517.1 hypothetical protein [Bacteroidota bacterium]
MEFKILENKTPLIEIETKSETKYQVIFKHLSRCSISAIVIKVFLSELSE